MLQKSADITEWKHERLECKDCGRKVTEGHFKVMTNERCGWHRGLPVKYISIKEPKERRQMERETEKKEQDEKAKACEWINEELSAQELLEEMSKCK